MDAWLSTARLRADINHPVHENYELSIWDRLKDIHYFELAFEERFCLVDEFLLHHGPSSHRHSS